jgi:hypothetical protein
MQIRMPRLKKVETAQNRYGRTYKITLINPDQVIERRSVTTRLSSVPSENLIQWRIKHEAAIHKEAAMRLVEAGHAVDGFAMSYDAMVQQIKKSREEYSPTAIGDCVHRLIEAHCTRGTAPLPINGAAQYAWESWLRWADDVGFQSWGCELPVWNGVAAGTLDNIGMVGGKLYVIDWKTSGRIYPEYDLQIGKYGNMLLEMFRNGDLVIDGEELTELAGGLILRLPKVPGGQVESRYRTRVEMDQDARRFDSVADIDEWVRSHGRGPLEVAVY